ncbi:Uu.00g052310.m01.CDS01 [Anthostomella pinea]|uniref:lytic cellulose monooxygenase (C4-dehydrogenating) n=1 Tax=Anthostomella pinea TaxID=933095 RepID=A0AAI8YPJ3_9PEZI|nr:Uu.00g052310.m01.CDS01 [Anthostomella pinea]
MGHGKDMVSTCARLPASNSPVTCVNKRHSVQCRLQGSELQLQRPSWRYHHSRDAPTARRPILLERSPRRQPLRTRDGVHEQGGLSRLCRRSSSWFKIFEIGYDASTKTWGNDLLNKNCGKQDVTIPADIAPGDYLLRAETIALHTASQANGAQFYMTCYQVTVTGGGSANPAGVKFPGAYNANDPGIKIDIWGSDFKEYTIPGPAVYGSLTGSYLLPVVTWDLWICIGASSSAKGLPTYSVIGDR